MGYRVRSVPECGSFDALAPDGGVERPITSTGARYWCVVSIETTEQLGRDQRLRWIED
jgi:hypothetical protein